MFPSIQHCRTHPLPTSAHCSSRSHQTSSPRRYALSRHGDCKSRVRPGTTDQMDLEGVSRGAGKGGHHGRPTRYLYSSWPTLPPSRFLATPSWLFGAPHPSGSRIKFDTHPQAGAGTHKRDIHHGDTHLAYAQTDIHTHQSTDIHQNAPAQVQARGEHENENQVSTKTRYGRRHGERPTLARPNPTPRRKKEQDTSSRSQGFWVAQCLKTITFNFVAFFPTSARPSQLCSRASLSVLPRDAPLFLRRPHLAPVF
ncbi:hypothetical protein IW262DRAFT_1373312 [Armillaria fumosa]|nr:hypothetical protein IW262DRAFT_1373312 [Armillaria fumosa]